MAKIGSVAAIIVLAVVIAVWAASQTAQSQPATQVADSQPGAPSNLGEWLQVEYADEESVIVKLRGSDVHLMVMRPDGGAVTEASVWRRTANGLVEMFCYNRDPTTASTSAYYAACDRDGVVHIWQDLDMDGTFDVAAHFGKGVFIDLDGEWLGAVFPGGPERPEGPAKTEDGTIYSFDRDKGKWLPMPADNKE